MKTTDTVDDELDLDAFLKRGQSPLPVVETRVRALEVGETLVLRVSFEPLPLFALLTEWGARYEVRSVPEGFRITVEKVEPPIEVPTFLDLRGLPPPEPLRRAMEAFERLKPGNCLIVHVPHRPMHLLELLHNRGIPWEEQAQEDGSYQVYLLKEES